MRHHLGSQAALRQAEELSLEPTAEQEEADLLAAAAAAAIISGEPFTQQVI